MYLFIYFIITIIFWVEGGAYFNLAKRDVIRTSCTRGGGGGGGGERGTGKCKCLHRLKYFNYTNTGNCKKKRNGQP